MGEYNAQNAPSAEVAIRALPNSGARSWHLDKQCSRQSSSEGGGERSRVCFVQVAHLEYGTLVSCAGLRVMRQRFPCHFRRTARPLLGALDQHSNMLGSYIVIVSSPMFRQPLFGCTVDAATRQNTSPHTSARSRQRAWMLAPELACDHA